MIYKITSDIFFIIIDRIKFVLFDFLIGLEILVEGKFFLFRFKSMWWR